MKLDARLKSELLRFLVVGGIAVALDAASYAFMDKVLHMDIKGWVKPISYGVGSIWAFFANKYFTFAIRELRASEPFLFAIVYLVGWALNAGIHYVVLQTIGVKALAFLAATGVSTCSNFIGQKFLVFRRKNPDAQP